MPGLTQVWHSVSEEQVTGAQGGALPGQLPPQVALQTAVVPLQLQVPFTGPLVPATLQDWPQLLVPEALLPTQTSDPLALQVIVVTVPPQTPQASFTFVLPHWLSHPLVGEQFGYVPQGVEPEQEEGGGEATQEQLSAFAQ